MQLESPFKAEKDPDRSLLRRAARLAIVLTVGLVLLWQIIGFPVPSVLFGCFAIFSLLIFADYGGPVRSRLSAYLATIPVGCISLIIGSALSFNTIASVLGTAVFGFVVAYAGVLRGYVAAAGTAVMVPFFIAISTPDNWSDVGSHLVAYVIGGLLATAGAMLIWPVYAKDRLRYRIADALEAAANAIGAQEQDSERDRDYTDVVLANAIDEVHKAYDASLSRPGAATSRQRDLMQIVDLLPSLRLAIRWRARVNPEPIHTLDDLSLNVVSVLRTSANAVRLPTKDPSAAPDLSALNASRVNDRNVAAHWIGQHIHEGAAETVDVLERRYPLRELSGLAVMIASRARDYVGADSQSEGMGAVHGRDIKIHLEHSSPRTALAVNFTPKSIWFINSLRAGLAYGFAVLVLLVLPVEHAFWVVLGTLAAMKFDAAGTRRTGMQMIIGTLIGFVLGMLLVIVTQDLSVVLWVLLPVTVFLAAFTPGTISLTIGQAAFTVFLVDLFGLLTPNGLGTDIVRVEDVALGVGVALIASLLLWPGGAKRVVNASLAVALDAVSDAFSLAYMLIPRKAEDLEFHAAATRAQHALATALENFDVAIAQQLPSGFRSTDWLRTHSASSEILLNADKIRFLAMGQTCPDSGLQAADAIIELAEIEALRLRDIGPRVIAGQPPADQLLSQELVGPANTLVTQFVDLQHAQKASTGHCERETVLALSWSLSSLEHIHMVISHVAHPPSAV